MLAAAEPYFREYAVAVWRTKAAHCERYEFLIHRVLSLAPVRSSPQLPYHSRHVKYGDHSHIRRKY